MSSCLCFCSCVHLPDCSVSRNVVSKLSGFSLPSASSVLPHSLYQLVSRREGNGGTRNGEGERSVFVIEVGGCRCPLISLRLFHLCCFFSLAVNITNCALLLIYAAILTLPTITRYPVCSFQTIPESVESQYLHQCVKCELQYLSVFL